MFPCCTCSSPANKFVSRLKEQSKERAQMHLSFQFLPHPVFLVGFDDKMMVVEIFNDKTALFIHGQQDLLHGGITTVVLEVQ